MRCRTAQYAIHLDREGECPPRLRERAIKHASACTRCGEELRRVEASAESLARIRRTVPRLVDPSQLTSAIMQEVERARAPKRRQTLLYFFPLHPSPRFRMALQSVAWTVAFLFTVQSLLDADSMSRLDERFDRQSAERAHGRVQPAGFESFLGLLRAKPPSPPAELERLLAKYPELSKITLDDGLDARERQILLMEGPRLVKDLEKFIMQGRNPQ